MAAQRRKPVEWNQHYLALAIEEGIPLMPGDSYRGSATKGGNRYTSKFGGSWINYTVATTTQQARWRLISYVIGDKKGKRGIVKHFSRQRTWKMTDIQRAYEEAEALAPNPPKVNDRLFYEILEAHKAMNSKFDETVAPTKKLVIKTGPPAEVVEPAPTEAAPEPKDHEIRKVRFYSQDEVDKLIAEAVSKAVAEVRTEERERFWDWYTEFSSEWAFNPVERQKMEESLATIGVGPPLVEVTSTFKVKKGASLDEVKAALENAGFRDVDLTT